MTRGGRFARLTLTGLLLLLAAGASASETPWTSEVLDRADFVAFGVAPAPADRPPDAGADWQPVALPHLWPLEHPGEPSVGWYRFDFEASGALPDRVGIYLPHFESNASVYLNGRWLADSGPPGSLNWNRPMYRAVSSSLLLPGRNTIHVRLTAYGVPGAGLRPIQVGGDARLRSAWQQQWWFRVGATRVGTALAVFAAMLFGGIWLGKSRDSVYGWCALSAVAWGVNSLNYHVHEIPVPFWAWKWLVHAGLDLFAMCTAFLVLRLVDVRMPRLERGILIFMALAVSLPILAPRDWFFPLANAFHAGSLALGIFAGGCVFWYRARLHRNEFATFAVLSLVFNGLLLRDYAIQVGWLPTDSPRLFHLTAPILFLGFAITLLVRFIATYRSAERSNVLLEQRVREKERELEHHYARVSELEQLHAVGQERERIMREMHDGMGGHLVSALSMLDEEEGESPELADALRSSLDEMRVMIHSLDTSSSDIPTLLGSFRDHLEPRLRRAGIDFSWKVSDLPAIERFGPEDHLHILRIFQEAVTNALKHSDAGTITVATRIEDEDRPTARVVIEVMDDGRGLDVDVPAGYGLRNMRFRAKALGGSLELLRASPGTRVELRLPISPA